MVLKEIIGVIMIIAGIIFGLYVGGWLFLVGGIVDLIEAIKATSTDAMEIAIGIVKILCAKLVGGLSFYLLAVPGYALLMD